MKRVLLKKDVLIALLGISRHLHPKETVVLLRGKETKQDIVLEEVLLAPASVYGDWFSEFRLDMLAIDFSIIGVAHSHPSGIPIPSVEDLNNMIGRVLVIVTAPYLNEKNIVAYNSKGESLQVVVDTNEG
ncbi:MAG: Mov34/MPN/PAD-1 family protein [Nitrososphaerota archaeon]|nr:Mov34/MPN/PAD-1 family protein [Aigarchaeota archaeon]MDW8076205.1 Mov34/MPN/PAD-1 family protein [Nitrososphaerota archaeon]